MAILKIARMGHPVLLGRAAEVADAANPEIRRLIRDMAETLADSGGVGLAAPQVFIPLRLFLYHMPDTGTENHVPDTGTETGTAMPYGVAINPRITPLSPERELGWEGCLSIPGLRGAVPRYRHIRLSAYDEAGQRFEQELTGFAARIIQHEYDHLDGVLYPMRMEDFRFFGFTEETARFPRPLPQPEPAESAP